MAPLAVVWAGAGLLLAVAHRQRTIPLETLVLDPAAHGGLPWYTGLISNLGILGWTTATVGAGLGAMAATHGARPGAATFLRTGALLSALLLLDDLFQLHSVIPRTVPVQKVGWYGLYLTLGLAWLAASQVEIRRTRWPLLAAACGALSTSVAVDLVGDGGRTALLAEDGAKFLGILAWAHYFAATANDIIGSLARVAAPEPAPLPIAPTVDRARPLALPALPGRGHP